MTYSVLRRFPRIHANHILRLAPLSSEVHDRIALTRVIGGGGCQITCEESFGVGTLMAVRLQVGLKRINPIARVAWENPATGGMWEIGLEFFVISPEDHQTLGEFIAGGLAAGRRPDQDDPAQRETTTPGEGS